MVMAETPGRLIFLRRLRFFAVNPEFDPGFTAPASSPFRVVPVFRG
jgi:hypothetical protein